MEAKGLTDPRSQRPCLGFSRRSALRWCGSLLGSATELPGDCAYVMEFMMLQVLGLLTAASARLSYKGESRLCVDKGPVSRRVMQSGAIPTLCLARCALALTAFGPNLSTSWGLPLL